VEWIGGLGLLIWILSQVLMLSLDSGRLGKGITRLDYVCLERVMVLNRGLEHTGQINSL
jgi:hypothetical protein